MIGWLRCLVEWHDWQTLACHWNHLDCEFAYQKCRRCGAIR
jgi:hypothetical protein